MPNHPNLFLQHCKAAPHVVRVWEQHYIIYYLHANYVVFVTIEGILKIACGYLQILLFLLIFFSERLVLVQKKVRNLRILIFLALPTCLIPSLPLLSPPLFFMFFLLIFVWVLEVSAEKDFR